MIPGYIADFVNNRIRRMYPKSGTITMIAGNGMPHRIEWYAGQNIDKSDRSKVRRIQHTDSQKRFSVALSYIESHLAVLSANH